jgi:hypothetical protein
LDIGEAILTVHPHPVIGRQVMVGFLPNLGKNRTINLFKFLHIYSALNIDVPINRIRSIVEANRDQLISETDPKKMTDLLWYMSLLGIFDKEYIFESVLATKIIGSRRRLLESLAVYWYTQPGASELLNNHPRVIDLITSEDGTSSPLVLMLADGMGIKLDKPVSSTIPDSIRSVLGGVDVSIVCGDVLLIDIVSFARKKFSENSPKIVPFDPSRLGEYIAVHIVDSQRDCHQSSVIGASPANLALNYIGRTREKFISKYIHTNPIKIEELNEKRLVQEIVRVGDCL